MTTFLSQVTFRAHRNRKRSFCVFVSLPNLVGANCTLDLLSQLVCATQCTSQARWRLGMYTSLPSTLVCSAPLNRLTTQLWNRSTLHFTVVHLTAQWCTSQHVYDAPHSTELQTTVHLCSIVRCYTLSIVNNHLSQKRDAVQSPSSVRQIRWHSVLILQDLLK